MDRRIKYTKKMIREAFIDSLDEKEINKITVSEICKKADINRATFYRYYIDIYDLLDNIKKDFEKELSDAVMSTEYTVSSFSKDLLLVLDSNRELVKILFSTFSFGNFLSDLLSIAYNKCSEKWKKDIPVLTDEEIEYANLFIFNGALGIVNFWIRNDFKESIDELSHVIEELSYYGTRRFIYKKQN